MSKPGKSLRNLCKKLGVRLTVKKGKKRIYKSVAVLKRQCSKKKRSKKKLLRGSKYGSKKKQTDKKNSIMNTLGKHKIKIGLGTLGVGGIGFLGYRTKQLMQGSVYIIIIPYLQETYKLGQSNSYTGDLFRDGIAKQVHKQFDGFKSEWLSLYAPRYSQDADFINNTMKYYKIEEMFNDTFDDGMNGEEPKHIIKANKFLEKKILGKTIRTLLTKNQYYH